jgi:hypothetical protein
MAKVARVGSARLACGLAARLSADEADADGLEGICTLHGIFRVGLGGFDR